MPLSEHEKRLLDEIEQTLRVEDPGLASSLRSARPQPRLATLIVAVVVSLLLAMALLVVGLRLASDAGTVIGVLGFAVSVGCGEATVRLVRTVRRRRRSRADGDSKPGSAAA
jgi:hypothetical protein